MAVLNLAASLGDILHALGAEFAALGIGAALVVAALVDGREHLVVAEDDVVLQLAHGVELHACNLAECLAGLVQRVLRTALQRITVLVEVAAQKTQGGNLGKRVDKRGVVAWKHIQVAAARLDEREQAAAVNALATSEHGLEVVQVVDDKVQRLELAVAARIHEVHHLDFLFFDIADEVGASKLGRGFLQVCHNRVGIQSDFLVFHIAGFC